LTVKSGSCGEEMDGSEPTAVFPNCKILALVSYRFLQRPHSLLEAINVRKPFQCRYCPYSASQKGNLKTHVLCVHRKPFDNSLYPDRRLRRSHTPQAPSRLSLGARGDGSASGRDHISLTSLCGT
ncbi:hypothetical protein GOODEAATRI_007722, partial [Goodea atripinnis]